MLDAHIQFHNDQNWIMDIVSNTFFTLHQKRNGLTVECSLEEKWSELLSQDKSNVMVIKRSTKDANGEERFLDYILAFFLSNGIQTKLSLELKVDFQLQTNIKLEIHSDVPKEKDLVNEIVEMCDRFEELIKHDRRFRLHFAVHDVAFMIEIEE